MVEPVELPALASAVLEALAAVRERDWARDVPAVEAKHVATHFEALPVRFVAYGVLLKALDDAGEEHLAEDLRVGRTIADQRRLPEFEPLLKGGVGVDVVFDLGVSKVGDAAVRCKAAKVPEIEYHLSDGHPYRLVVSLPVWLGLDEAQRAAAVHGALCTVLEWHTTVSRGRLSVHPATMARFGPQSTLEAEAIAHAMARPAIAAELRRFDFDAASGQGLLFETDYNPALARVQESIDELRSAAGVSSVTISAGGKSVTLTGEDRKRKHL